MKEKPLYQRELRTGDKLLNLREVMGITCLSRARIYSLMHESEGIFPRPIKIGKHRVAWIESEVISYINEKISERNLRIGKKNDKQKKVAS